MVPFPEISEQELIRLRWSDGPPFAVYLYTPWCGTCKIGERMLTVVGALEPSALIFRSNVNFLPSLVQEWKIESVPCLAFVAGKRVTEKVYTMRSVDYLLEVIRTRLTG